MAKRNRQWQRKRETDRNRQTGRQIIEKERTVRVTKKEIARVNERVGGGGGGGRKADK